MKEVNLKISSISGVPQPKMGSNNTTIGCYQLGLCRRP